MISGLVDELVSGLVDRWAGRVRGVGWTGRRKWTSGQGGWKWADRWTDRRDRRELREPGKRIRGKIWTRVLT